ncbi:hypothetical protein [Nocardioides sp. LS1]|uniref:hypothetical protein n=1 Tax=Nocardioides sp. LS1 TaxID=1027620 RepID=UPI000F61F29E|nr:hypothetical protein [Nocardioides sp. LS1]GCD89622.1 hypothetical protein NLS1_16280 [Nocardioides sp. LS1]
MTSTLEPAWAGLVDDAAIFPPAETPLADAVTAYVDRRGHWSAPFVASFVVTDVRLPEVGASVVEPVEIPVSVVVTGGAGAIAGALRLAARHQHPVAGLEIALRDLDDLPGNARRVVAAVDAARDEGLMGDDTPVFLELPHAGSTATWLAAADVAAERELRLKFRTGGLEAHLFPAAHALARWIDAALDRETPFKCTAGLHNAVRHTGPAADGGFEHHGFLNVLLATRRAFDGAGLDEVVATLEERDGATLAAAARAEDLGGARRWFTSFGSCSVTEPLDDLIALGLLEDHS